jgi:hypothetical protein
MAEVGAIEKGRRNQQQGYAFRGIDDAYAAFQPLFAKHGLFVVPTVLERIREERKTVKDNGREGVLIYTTLTVRHTFTADDGSFVEAVTIGEAMDSGDKSSNKAMSAAMKYALLEVFCVPTEDDNDTENHSHEPRATAKPVSGSAANTTPPARTAPTSTPRPTAPADTADAPAATPAGGFREFWPEQEITSQTTIVVASIEAVNVPVKSERTGNFGPYKIDVKTDDQLFTVDTFDKVLADICKLSGNAMREVAFNETTNGRFPNRKLVGVR